MSRNKQHAASGLKDSPGNRIWFLSLVIPLFLHALSSLSYHSLELLEVYIDASLATLRLARLYESEP